MAASPADGAASNIVFATKRGLMTKLPAEAYAIIEGRHSDPFHYLGLHKEGDKTVVRAFLPEASNVEAIGEHGEAAALACIHEDRKSTRLNSSHVAISYAVFCLKKK